jgi:acetate kinase
MNLNPVNILTLNSGSSSLKFAIYESGPAERRILSGHVERIGRPGALFEIREEASSRQRKVSAPDHVAAVNHIFKELAGIKTSGNISVIGHRIVMGGPRYSTPQRINATLLKELHALSAIDPQHMPAELKTIIAAGKFHPNLPQIACFDTAFHRTMPPVAQTFPLPRKLTRELGLLRFGFHGLSYEYIMSELRRIAPISARGKVIIAHLGNGASMAAVHRGKCVDTTMGFTPAGGLMMGSRTGDLDPGALVHVISRKKYSAAQLNHLINEESGLLGVSGLSPDMRDLTRAKQHRREANEALALFCYQARKALGALVAALNGLETLVFTGGIGEHSPLVRANICKGMAHLGLQMDHAKNAAGDAEISTRNSPVKVRVIKTNEELMIARHAAKLLSQ